MLARVVSAAAQTALPVDDPAKVATLSFQPGRSDTLLLATTDGRNHLQARLVHIAADGRPSLSRTLPGSFSSAAWLDADNLVTGGADGTIERWPIGGGEATVLARLPEPIVGIGVGPVTHTLAIRLGETLHLLGPDGRPNGPTITLGRPTKPAEVCPPDGIETTPAFSTDERLIAFSGLCGDLRVSGRDGTRLMRAELPRGVVKRHAFSNDGRMLIAGYTGAPASAADLWPIVPGRLANPKPLPGLALPDDPADLAALPDKPGFIVLSADRVRFVTPEGSPLQGDLSLAAPKRVAVSFDGSRIAVAAAEGLVLFDATGKRLLARPFADFGAPVALATIAGGAQIAVVSHSGELRVWRVDGSEAHAPFKVWDADGESAGETRLLVSPNGRRIGVLAPNRQLDVFDENWNHVGRPIRFPADPSGALSNATVLLDDRLLRPLPDGSGFLAFSFDGGVLGRMTYGDHQPIVARAAAASNRTIAVFAADGRLALWSSEGQPIRQRRVEGAAPVEPLLDIAADGKTIVLHDTHFGTLPMFMVWHPIDETLLPRDGLFAGFLADGSVLRFARGHLITEGPNGTVQADLALDADSIDAVMADGKAVLARKNGVPKVVKIAP